VYTVSTVIQSVNTCFAGRDISVLSEGISIKLDTDIHPVIGQC